MNKKTVMFIMTFCVALPLYAVDYSVDTVEKRGSVFYVKETQQPLTGTLIRTYPNGKKLAESVFVEGTLNGESRGFQENGKLDHTIEFQNNLKEGLYKQYDPNGILRIEGSYHQDKLNGILKIYNPAGILQITETYKNGLLNGERLEYYENGIIKSKAIFEDNQLNGVFQEFYTDGKPQSEITFQKGIKQGPAKVFYPNGKLHYEMNFNQNKTDGENNQYDAVGNILGKRIYQNGAVIGGFTLKNGKQVPLSTKQLDELNSKMILHTPQNTYKKEGILYDSNNNTAISGIFRVTRENGSIQEEYEFLNGRPHGISQFFNDKGHLTQQNLFNNGVKIGYRLMDEVGRVIKMCKIDEQGAEDCQ